jgi:uncharacterized protein (TIGR04255 family)
MNRLPNAPLIEVIFELSWKVETSDERERFQFLLGDMYTKLKDKYPVRESLVDYPVAGVGVLIDSFNNRPLYRFRVEKDSHPLYQLGPGLLSVNTTGEVYTWENFEQEILHVFKEFRKSYGSPPIPAFDIALKFMDFYEFDFENNNAYDFLKKYLHLQIEHSMQSEKHYPSYVYFSAGHQEEEGSFTFTINRGLLRYKKEGILVETCLAKKKMEHIDGDEVPLWIKGAHNYLSNVFKKMTAGEMYASFLN